MRMLELSRYLFMAGALPFIVLGVAHVAGTPQVPADAKGLSPRDPAVREAMVRDTILLTHRTTVWLAWVGFNLSHSLGVILFGVVALLIGRNLDSFEAQATVFLPLTVAVSGVYLVLAARYWFKTPFIWIAFSSVCFLVSWVLFVARPPRL
jgi:hypothetical protein